MTIGGWHEKYLEILNEFRYDRTREMRSAKILDSLLKDRFPTDILQRKIRGRTVLAIGAGPSLGASMSHVKKFKNVTNIVADGATEALLENNITPDIIVTDLDGDMESLKEAAERGSIMVVHAHGDNIGRLPYAISFRRCLGTTEDKPFGKIMNFGGFTDGDRCVFLANHFGASRIILVGMDFGTSIGRYSKHVIPNRSAKIKKMKRAKSLLRWLASKSDAGFYTTSHPIAGFEKICVADLQRLVSK